MWAISASPIQVTTSIMNCTAAPSPPAPACSLTLQQQLSRAACTLGASYGCGADNVSMWTSAGCRGDFLCNGVAVAANTNGTGVHTYPCSSTPPAAVCKGWLSDLQKEILLNEEVLAVNQDVTPQGRPIADSDISVWARALSDGSVAVALYNENDAPATLGVQFTGLGWPAGTAASVRDLWAHADLGVFTGAYPAAGGVSVAPHETRLLRLTKQ
jgi:hypothetical protein